MPIVEGQAIPATTCSHNAPGQPIVAAAGRATLCRQCGAVLEPEARGVNAANQVAPVAVNPTRVPAATSVGILAQYPGHGQI